MRVSRRATLITTVAAAFALTAAACTAPDESGTDSSPTATTDAEMTADAGPLVVYSGRSEELVAPLFEMFEAASGIEVDVRYANSAEQAQLLLTEGENSPGHVFLSQEAGALGLVGASGLLVDLPADVLAAVPAEYTADDGTWVGITGRARVVVYDSEQVSAEEAPDTAAGIVDPQWAGQVGVAPGNASFLAFVTAMREIDGEDATAAWLDSLVANDAQAYESNGDILEAVNAGELQLGLINHYYWFRTAAELGADNMRAQLKFGADGDLAALVNATAVGILTGGEGRSDALAFVEFLHSEEAQNYFAEQSYEYPLVPGIAGPEGVPSLESLVGPDIDLSLLGTVDESAALVDEAGLTVG